MQLNFRNDRTGCLFIGLLSDIHSKIIKDRETCNERICVEQNVKMFKTGKGGGCKDYN